MLSLSPAPYLPAATGCSTLKRGSASISLHPDRTCVLFKGSYSADTEMKRLAVHLTQRRGGRTKPQQKVSKFKGKGRKEISQGNSSGFTSLSLYGVCQNITAEWAQSSPCSAAGRRLWFILLNPSAVLRSPSAPSDPSRAFRLTSARICLSLRPAMCNPFTLNSKCNRPHGHRTRPVNINLDDSLLHRLLSTDAGVFMSIIATQAPAAIEFPLPRSPFIASKPASQGRFSPTHTHTHTHTHVTHFGNAYVPVSALEREDPFVF
ncbi:hypothetical protein PO909_022801 [Leuciscus waleckii]